MMFGLWFSLLVHGLQIGAPRLYSSSSSGTACSSALVVGLQEEMMSLLAAWYFQERVSFLQRSFLMQHGAVDIITLEGATNTL